MTLYPDHAAEAAKSPRPTLAETIAAREAPAPWTQRDNISPIYDALGKVVSFTQQGPRIVAAVNESAELREMLNIVTGHLEFASVSFHPDSTSRGNADRAAADARALLERVNA